MKFALGLVFAGALGSVACSSNSSSSSGTKPVTGTPPVAANWVNQGYDVQSTWRNPLETTITPANVAQLAELWHQTVAAQGTPAVVGKRVYTSSGAAVFALDADTGAVVWQTGTDNPIGSGASMAFDSNTVYVDSSSGGTVVALNAANGVPLWTTQYETNAHCIGWSSPIVVGDLVIVGDSSGEEFVLANGATFKGSVVAMDKTTGAIRWTVHTAGPTENGATVWGSVSADPVASIVYAATGNNYTDDATKAPTPPTSGPGSDSVFAIDMQTGNVNWHKQVTQNDVYTSLNPRSPDTDFGANPVVFDFQGQQLLAAGQKSGDIYVFDRMTGAIVSHRLLGPGSALPGGVFQGPAWDGTHLLVVCNHATSVDDGGITSNGQSPGGSTSVLFSVEPLTGDIVWERQLPAWVWVPITIANGIGFVGIETDLQAFDVTDGKILKDWTVAGSITGGPAIVNGRLYFATGLSFVGVGHADNQFHSYALPK